MKYLENPMVYIGKLLKQIIELSKFVGLTCKKQLFLHDRKGKYKNFKIKYY